MEKADNKKENKDKQGPVLVAVDFSADSDAALEWACDYALCMNAPLLILHVIHDPAYAPGFYRKDEEDWSLPMSKVAERLLSEFVVKMRDRLGDCKPLKQARIEQVTGLPPGRIVDVAEAENARLIVIGSRGRTGLAHILLGSVAERVVQMSPVPVVVIKASEQNSDLK